MESRRLCADSESGCSRCFLCGPSVLFGDGVPDSVRLSGRCGVVVTGGDRNLLLGGRGRAMVAGPCGARGV